MARIFIVDERGARAGDLAASRERFDEANKEAFGADLDIHAHTPQNQIAGINALVATELGEELVRAALYGASVNHAVGIFLDSLGGLLDIRRNPETKSRVVALLSGVVGTRIPKGSLAKNANGDTFESEVDAIIVDGGVRVGFVATDPGPKNVDAGSLTRIVSVRTGWDAITNPADGIVGRERESDALYRANLKARTAHSSIGSIAALESALHSAGASRIKILENSGSSSAIKGGVNLPAHSLLVIADGGLDDDIARAVENSRGMGVNTYTAFEGSSFSLSQAQKINNGRMIFNGTEFGGFNLGGSNVFQMASALNASTNIATFAESDGKILTLHSWDPESTGFSDIGGNITESNRPILPFKPIYSVAHGSLIFMLFPEELKSDPTWTVKYTNAGSETTATVSASGRTGRFARISLSAAIPATATDIKVSTSSVDTVYSSGLSLSDLPIELSTGFGSTDAPSVPFIVGRPRNQGAYIYGFAIGTITKWQYRRWSNGSYIDSDWVDSAGTSFGGTSFFDGTFTSNNITNGEVSRIEVRAVNGAHGETATRSYIFEASNTAPSVTDAHIDGNLITLTYNDNINPDIIASPNAASWSIHAPGSASSVATVDRIRTIGRQAILTTSTQISAGTSWQIDSTSTSDVFGLNGVRQAVFTNRALTNDTKAGIPSAPIEVLARRTANGWESSWRSNYNGGLNIDRYEISTLPTGSNIWSEWTTNSPSASTSYSINTATIPARVRVRASNQNARSAEILGLLGTRIGTLPFARSVARPLVIGVSIHRDANITTSDFDAIKSSLVDLVNSYELGSTIYQADLQARVEGIRSIRLESALTVTSNGVSIDGVAQNAYNRWTLDPNDISVTFVN